MTTMNEAFIKAYQAHQSGESTLGAPHFPLQLQASRPEGQAEDATREGGVDAPTSSPSTLRAAYEVEVFQWPDAVLELHDAAGEQFEAFASTVELPSVVLITGCKQGEGRTTMALTLARWMASGGCRVVLMDGHWKQPKLADLLGILPQAGCDDVLAGREPLAEALVESTADQLTLLPLRGKISDQQARAGQARLASILRTLRAEFDLVLVDGTHVSSGSNEEGVSSIVASAVDMALVVRDVRRTSQEESLAVGRQLTLSGIKRWQIAENFVPSESAGAIV